MKTKSFILAALSVSSFAFANISFQELNDMGSGEISYQLVGNELPQTIYTYFVSDSGQIDYGSESITTMTESPLCLGQDSLPTNSSTRFGILAMKDTDNDLVPDTVLDFISARGMITIAPSPATPAFLYGINSIDVGCETDDPTLAYRLENGVWTGAVPSACNASARAPNRMSRIKTLVDTDLKLARLSGMILFPFDEGRLQLQSRSMTSPWKTISLSSINRKNEGGTTFTFTDNEVLRDHRFYRIFLRSPDGKTVSMRSTKAQPKRDRFHLVKGEKTTTLDQVDLPLEVEGAAISKLSLVTKFGKEIKSWSNLQVGINYLEIPVDQMNLGDIFFLRTDTDIIMFNTKFNNKKSRTVRRRGI